MPPASVFVPQVSSSCLLSLQETLRSEGGFAQGFFKLLPLSCVLGSCQILCEPIKSGISILLSSLGLPKVRPHWSSKLYIWGLVFPVQDPWSGGSLMGLGPVSLGRISGSVIISQVRVHQPEGMGLVMLCFLLPVSICGNVPSLYL